MGPPKGAAPAAAAAVAAAPAAAAAIFAVRQAHIPPPTSHSNVVSLSAVCSRMAMVARGTFWRPAAGFAAFTTAARLVRRVRRQRVVGGGAGAGRG